MRVARELHIPWSRPSGAAEAQYGIVSVCPMELREGEVKLLGQKSCPCFDFLLRCNTVNQFPTHMVFDESGKRMDGFETIRIPMKYVRFDDGQYYIRDTHMPELSTSDLAPTLAHWMDLEYN